MDQEYSVQLRASDGAKSSAGVGVGVLLALFSSSLEKSVKGGLTISGGLIKLRGPSILAVIRALE